MRRVRAFSRLIYRRSGLRCRLDRHRPVRLILPGYRCATCGLAGAELQDFGLMDGSDFVSPIRTTFSRRHGAIERSTGFEETSKEWRTF